MLELFKSCQTVWLSGDERLFTLKLTHVEEPLDPAPLWDHRHGGGKGIEAQLRDGARGDRFRLRLREALDAHCFTVNVQDKRGWLTEERKVFGDLVVRVPPTRWNRDIQIGGQGIERLADNLARLVEQDFGPDLLPERGPSCAVMPGFGIEAPDEVVIQFGLGVYIPRENEIPVGEVSLKTAASETWAAPSPWIFWKGGRRITRPSALYAGQQFLLMGPRTALEPPMNGMGRAVWFEHGRGHILFNLTSEDAVLAFGDEENVGNGQVVSRTEDGGTMIFAFNGGNGAGEDEQTADSIMVKITRRPAGEQPVEDAPGHSPGRDRPGRSGRTILPEESVGRPLGEARTLLPGRITPQLVLTGIALPRIDTPDTGISGLKKWIIWLDESGLIVDEPPPPERRAQLAALSAASDQPNLFFRKPGDTEFSVVPGAPFRPSDIPIEVLPSPVPEKHHGILLLRQPPFFPLENGRRRIGRAVHMPDIRLTFTLDPECLVWAEGYEQPGNLIDIGLSRDHAVLSVAPGKIAVAMSRGSLPVYVLGPERSSPEHPAPNRAEAEDARPRSSPTGDFWKIKYVLVEGSAEEIPLIPGDGLIIGGYVLRLISGR